MAQVGDAERTEIRQLYEVGTQVHVLEQMYPPDVVKAVVEEVDNEKIMADQLKEIESQNALIEEENKRASMAVPAGDANKEEAEDNNNGDDAAAAQEKAMMENLLKAAEEAEAAKAVAEAKMAAEREAARLEEEKARIKEEEDAARLAEEEARQKAQAEAAEKARLEEEERIKAENEAREKREAEQKAALEKLEKEKEAQERFIQKQKELEEQENARVAAEEEARQKAEAEAARIEEEERMKAEREAAEKARLEEEERIKAEKEAAEKARLEEEERLANEAAEAKKEKEEEEGRLAAAKKAAQEEENSKGKADRRLTSEIDDEVERLALEMQAELDKFDDDDGHKGGDGESKAIDVDDVADKLARDMQRELDKLGSTSKGDDDIEKIDDVADQLAKEMQMEMDKLGLDDSKKFDDMDSSAALEEGKQLIGDVKALLGKAPEEEEEEEMEIDFLADLNDSSPKGNDNLTTKSSIRNLVEGSGKVSQITGKIEKKTKIKPFIKPDEGALSSKQVSPSVRSKEVRVVPFVCPKSKAQKSADMKNPKTRPADSPGKLDPTLRSQKIINTMPTAPLPRVAKLSPTRITARELKPSRPRSKSPRPTPGRLKPWSPAKSPNTPPSPPVALPRVATLPSPVRPTFDSSFEALPPKITAPPIIPPRSRTEIKHTFPRVLSPRGAPTCPTPYDPELHGSKGPCERCMELASEEEKEKFAIKGHHLRIMMVSGGCDRSCLVFPRGENGIPVRLCKKCYFDTHRTYYDALESHPPPVER